MSDTREQFVEEVRDHRLALGGQRAVCSEARHCIGALTDTLAAASWGMPIVARGVHPLDISVPSESDLRAARSVLGEASDPNTRACTVAVAPVRLACLRRHDHSATTGERWPVANHIIVALAIAQDRARGLEALEQWQPATTLFIGSFFSLGSTHQVDLSESFRC